MAERRSWLALRTGNKLGEDNESVNKQFCWDLWLSLEPIFQKNDNVWVRNESTTYMRYSCLNFICLLINNRLVLLKHWWFQQIRHFWTVKRRWDSYWRETCCMNKIVRKLGWNWFSIYNSNVPKLANGVSNAELAFSLCRERDHSCGVCSACSIDAVLFYRW